MHRRAFLSRFASAVPLLALPAVGAAGSADVRALQLRHLHTGERLAVEYARGGRYLPEALAAIDHVLRDFRTRDVHPIDPALLDQLHALSLTTGTRQPFEVISGYRSPVTNTELRSRSQGVASSSLHMSGRAIDVRLADVPLATLRDAAYALRRGGVGYYPASNFVHIDTGRVRRW